MNNSRSNESLNNAFANVVGQVISLLVKFIVRIYFIKKLGDIYLSINGLFLNIISVLSIAELGIGFAIGYSMYKPLSQKDTNKVNQLLYFYKTVYRIIGVIVFCVGICLLPFLKYLVQPENMVDDIFIIFMLFLLRSCMSYWLLSYRSTLINADQKSYKTKKFSYLTDILCAICEIISLIFCQSFVVYLLISIFFLILNNIITGTYIAKLYPYIKNKPQGKLSKEEKKVLFKNIYSVALYKISGTIYTSSDSIIIAASTVLPFVLVGYYSNYTLIFTAISGLISAIVSSTSASIGNFNVTESAERKRELFNRLNFVNFWIYGVFAICSFALINPFISILYGSARTLDIFIVLTITINFLMDGLGGTVIRFKDSCGMFVKGRFRPIFSAILNIVFSIALIYPFGLAGVMLGTILSRLCTTFWYDTQLIYKNVFNHSAKEYYLKYLFQFFFTCLVGATVWFGMSFITITNIFQWVLWGIILFVFTNAIFFVCFRKTKNYQFIKEKVFSYVVNIMKKVKKIVFAIIYKLFVRPIKKIAKKFRKIPYILLDSQIITMDEHLLKFYESIKDRNYKIKVAYFGPNKKGKTVLDPQRAIAQGFDKKMVIKNKISYIFQSPDILVQADNSPSRAKFFDCKKINIGHGGSPTVNDKTDSGLPYIYGESARYKGKVLYDVFLEANKEVIPDIESIDPKLKNRIWFSGNKFIAKYEENKNKQSEFKKQLSIDNNKKTIMIIGSWGPNSLFHKLGKSLFEEIKELLQTNKYAFILSIHPREYTDFKDGNEPFGKYVDELSSFGAIIRKPGEDALPYIAASDLVFCDYSSMLEEAIMCEKDIVLSAFNSSALYRKAPAVILQDKIPVITDSKDLKTLIKNKYKEEYKKHILDFKKQSFASNDFYKEVCIKAVEYLLGNIKI